ncbi:MAG: (2Fe-2S)-binding protein [Pseudomonadales bacterium]
MDVQRKCQDPSLVCTCNDFYIEDIIEACEFGEDEYREIFAFHGTSPRCGGCQSHVEQLISAQS